MIGKVRSAFFTLDRRGEKKKRYRHEIHVETKRKGCVSDVDRTCCGDHIKHTTIDGLPRVGDPSCDTHLIPQKSPCQLINEEEEKKKKEGDDTEPLLDLWEGRS